MERINKLLTNTKSAEIYAMIDSFIRDFDNSGLITDKYLAGIMDLLKTESQELITAISPVRTKSEQQKNDKARLKIYLAINTLLKGYICHPDKEVNTAAEKVYKVFKRSIPGVLNRGFRPKDASINSVLRDLSDDSLKKPINALSGLQILINDLSAAQEKFGKDWLIFLERKAAEKNKDSATKIGKNALLIINKKLVTYLNAMEAVNQKGYKDFAALVRNEIKENNIAVKKRSGKRKLDKSDEA